MINFTTKASLKQHLISLSKDNKIGFVPTMGSLHEGHLSLIKRAWKENNTVVISIFINPTQFNNQEDFNNYPADINSDIHKIENTISNPIIYTPTAEDVYEAYPATKTFDFNGLDKVMEGRYRKGHFNGVATVVSFFLNLIRPNRAYFGEKDFQQLQIVRALVQQLQLPVQIISCAISREDNGLARSSRNERLSKTAREQAGIIYQEISRAIELLKSLSIAQVQTHLRQSLIENTKFKIEYVEIADEKSLTPTAYFVEGHMYRLFIAIFVEDVRLIDNIALDRKL